MKNNRNLIEAPGDTSHCQVTLWNFVFSSIFLIFPGEFPFPTRPQSQRERMALVRYCLSHRIVVDKRPSWQRRRRCYQFKSVSTRSPVQSDDPMRPKIAPGQLLMA